ncbi:TPA: major capsid protein [Raoultella terrigena]|uniref:Major capsid protein n=1 Tax=Raoultella terrigena TaxID=577 RepID=A0AAP9XPI7_RAOTE|nr:major capsid protein [Raoultella terrigena]QPF08293.1 major capsid protein [Raoultella terrigena]
MTISTSGFKVNYYSGAYKERFGDNFLLQALDIFKDKTSPLPKLEIDELQENMQSVAASVNRYSSEVSVTERPRSKNRLVEIPHFVTTGNIGAESFQGRRRVGTQRQTAMGELVSDEGIRQYMKFRATKEAYLARALFSGQVLAPYTQDRPVLDFEDEFGQTHATATINATKSGDGLLEDLDTAANAMRFALGGWLSSMRGVVVLCSPEAYKAIKFHKSMLTLVNHGVLPDSNLFNASVKANLPAFQAMTIDGLTFVNTGLLYRDFIPAGTAFMVPVFGANNLIGSDLQPFECYHGCASRDARLAADETESLFFQYGWEDHLHNQTIQSEYGLLPICYNQSMITKLTVNTTEG